MGVEGIYTAIRKTKIIAIYQLITRVLMIVCTVLPVICIGNDYKVAIIGWGAASLITFVIAMYLKRKPYINIDKEQISGLYKQLFSYTAPLLGAFIFGFIISSADQFFISRYYGVGAFADYSNGCISIPIAVMITSSVKDVLLPIFSKADHIGNIQPALESYKNAVNKSAVLVFPFLIFCFVFSKEIMVFLYGNQYATSAVYMKSYIIRDFISILPYFSILMALSMSKTYMYMHLWGAIFVWGLDYIVITTGMPAYCIVIVRSLFYLFSLIYAFFSIYKRTKIKLLTIDLFRNLFMILIYCSTFGYITYYLSASLLPQLPPLATIMLAFIVYYIFIFVLDKIDKRFVFFGAYSVVLNKIKK